MKIDFESVKNRMIMCRFSPDIFKQVEKLAKKHKTSRGKIIGALVEKALTK